VRHLLDTHSLLWYAVGDSKLSKAAEALILDPVNEILVSPASYWEIAIKVSLGKLRLHRPFEDFMDVCLNTYGFAILPIEPRHTAKVVGLPFHHKAPFDRLLVAQALVKCVSVISNDPSLDAYGIVRHW
jgi:PIN domain nuclease of toxin-antitoxin system